MSRFYLNLKLSPKIIIEFTEDLSYELKPFFINFFGMPFLLAETKDMDLFRYEFEADINDCELMMKRLKSVYGTKIVKNIDININMN